MENRNWKAFKLGKVTTKIGSGSTPTGGSNAYKDEGISLIRSQNVLDFTFSNDGLAFIDDEQAFRLRGVTVEENDILFNITGDSVARVCKVPSQILPARVNQHVAILRADNINLHYDFLLYLMQSKKEELLIMSEIGATRNAITKVMLENLELQLPPLPEQKAITSVLSSLDDKIDLLHQQNQTLEALAETLFRQWFIEEAKEDWEEVELYDFIDFLEGPGLRNWQYTDHGTRFVNIRLINNGEVDIKKSNFVSDEEANGRYSHFLLKEKDIIVSTSGTLGKSAIIRDYHLPLMLNTSVIRFRPKDNINYSFIYQYLQSDIFLNHLENTASGSVQLNFGPTHLKQMKMVLPDELTLGKYRLAVDPLYEKLNLNYKKIQTLTQLRDTLLPKLMSGEVRVKN